MTKEKLFDLMMRDPCPSPVVCDPHCKYYKSHHCHAERYADHLIANGVVISKSETTTKWIPVTERLPERDKTVLAIDRVTGEITTAYLNFCDSFVFEDGRGHGASHWMPLPEPPKGE